MSHLSSLSSFCHCMWLTLCTSILFDKHDIVSSYSSTNSTSNFMNIRIHVFVNSYTEYRPIRLKYTRSFIKIINGSNLQFFKWFRIKIWSKKKKNPTYKKSACSLNLRGVPFSKNIRVLYFFLLVCACECKNFQYKYIDTTVTHITFLRCF